MTTLSDIEEFASNGKLTDGYFEQLRQKLDALEQVNKTAKMRKIKAEKLARQIEHYGRGVARRMGLPGLKITVCVEEIPAVVIQ